MHPSGPTNPNDRHVPASRVALRLYVSGRSEYTRSVLDTVDRVLAGFHPDDFGYEVRDARDAEESEHVFFTPMLIITAGDDPTRRTVIVGDLRQTDLLAGVLARYGVVPRADAR